jgi:hypothetical protein
LRTAAILNEHQLNALLAWLDTRKHAGRNRLIVLLSFKSGYRQCMASMVSEARFCRLFKSRRQA